MFELLYISVSPAGLSEKQLAEILECARYRNKKLGVTGMLTHHDRENIQLLEGDESAVREIFKSICADDRHTGVEIFYEGGIAQRAFSDWSMAYKNLDTKDLAFIAAEYKAVVPGSSPLNMVAQSKNRGKMTFMRLRDSI